jgi:hypothetical protein
MRCLTISLHLGQLKSYFHAAGKAVVNEALTEKKQDEQTHQENNILKQLLRTTV